MENLNFNSQPKQKSPDKEKTPEAKVLMIEGLDFEYKETRIEFPEYLIMETGGVKGYIRKQFDSMESIREKIKEAYKNSSSEGMEDFLINGSGSYHTTWKKNDVEDIRETFFYYKTAEVFNQLYDLATSGEFPENTSLNFLKAYTSKSDTAQVMRHFSEDKLFLQKIFGSQRFHHKSIRGYSQTSFIDTENKTVLQDINWNTGRKNYNLKKKDGTYGNADLRKFFVEKPSKRISAKESELINEFETEELSKVDSYMQKYDDLFNQVNSNEGKLSLFMLGTAGLHCQNKDASGDDGLGWGSPSRVADADAVFSGFSIKNKAFKEYLEKVKTMLETLPEEVIKKEASKISLDTINYFLQNKDHVYSCLEHPAIPIIQGYPNIPDLRWCHASYMSIPTKNGLNILEFIT